MNMTKFQNEGGVYMAKVSDYTHGSMLITYETGAASGTSCDGGKGNMEMTGCP